MRAPRQRAREVALLAVLVALSGCRASIPPSPTPAPVPPIAYTVRPAGLTLPPKTESSQALDVLSARLRSLAVGPFSGSIGDAITFEVPASANEAAISAVLSATGQVDVVPLPPAAYGTLERPGPMEAVAGTSLPSREVALFGRDQIADARTSVDASGGPVLSITLASEGSRLFAAYTSAHVGEFFALVLDGRVMAVPVVLVAVTDGALIVSLPADTLQMPLEALAAILASGPLPDSWRQGPVPAPPASPQPAEGATSAIHIDNGTALAVSILVNGRPLAVVPPAGYDVVVDAARVSAPPWRVEAATSSGRVLGTLIIPAPTVAYALRLDLSCGRLDVWLGAPLGGGPSPAASPGTTGDCTP